MKFTYAYKTSEGTRHTEEVEASSREAVFEALRAKGIRPIKVVAADGSKANGEPSRPTANRVVILSALSVLALICAIIIYLASYNRRMHGGSTEQESTGSSPASVASQIATPLPRQAIPGSRKRIEEAAASLPNAPERLLAAFAEPGRPIAGVATASETGANEWASALNTPLHFSEDEFTESIDLKRIVTKMKNDTRMYLSNGGTPEDFIDELIKRQKLEISYRDKAETKLNELVSEIDGSSANNGTKMAEAYDFWLKANAQLQSMGIYALPLPEVLRDYQMSLDFE